MMKTIIDTLTFIDNIKLKTQSTINNLATTTNQSIIHPTDYTYLKVSDIELEGGLENYPKGQYIYLSDPHNLELIQQVWAAFKHYPIDMRNEILFDKYLPESLELNCQGIKFGSLSHRLFSVCFVIRYF